MPRTVLGWRCRWGPGRSLPTSYTSPRATNKPLIVFPIHTDRGHYCLGGFTPCLSGGPWFTPFQNYLYSSVSFTQFGVLWTQHGWVVVSSTIMSFLNVVHIYILTNCRSFWNYLFTVYCIWIHSDPKMFSLKTHRQCGNLPNVTDLGRWITVCILFFFPSSRKNTPDRPLTCIFSCIYKFKGWRTLVGAELCVAQGVKQLDVGNMLQAPVAVSPATA